MKTKITLLSLLLLIATIGFAQQEKLVNQHFINDALFEMHPVLSGNSYTVRTKANINIIQTLDSVIKYDITSNNQLINLEKNEYTYDSNGNMTEYLFSLWLNNQWTNYSKNKYSYDTNGNLIEYIYYQWDDVSNQWNNKTKKEYNYDSNGYLTLKKIYDWNNNQWNYNKKYEYTYDTNGNLILKNKYIVDVNTSQWINVNKIEYSYDTNGNIILVTVFYNDNNTGQWINGTKAEYTYHANGNKTIIYYYWDDTSSQWIYLTKYEYSYDTNGNLARYIYFEWDNNSRQWINRYKNENTIDLLINRLDLIEPDYYFNTFQNKLLEVLLFLWDDAANSWGQLNKKSIFYYSDTSAINELSDNNINLYPNPVSSDLNIYLKNNSGQALFELFDMQGHKLLSRKVYEKDQINLNGLSSGVYLYTIMIDGGKKSGKLIKK